MELMSPAGNLKSLIAAIEAGADSIYMGYLKFNARRPADNFDVVLLKKVVDFAHSKGKKIYLVLNIDLKSSELSEALRVIEYSVKINIDAIIVKDYGLVSILSSYYKGKIQFHASTQIAITSSEGALFAEKTGFSRIVLARELDIDEIKAITEKITISTEVFVEGSMCFSVSGRCLMSSWVGGRSGNRGGCTAPCRLQWDSSGKKYTFFSMKDMLLVFRLSDIEKSGVDSLKIEGRLKSYAWVYAITKVYREALAIVDDKEKIENFKSELSKYSARDTGDGHFFGHSDLIGSNDNWDNYKKGTEVSLETNPGIFDIVIIIDIIENENNNLICTVQVENTVESMEFAKPLPAKKGRSVELTEIKSTIQSLIEYKTAVININVTEHTAAATQILKIAETIVNKVKLLVKRVNELPVVSDELKKVVEYNYENFKRPVVVGGFPDKLLIDYTQFSFFANEEKVKNIKTITAEIVSFPDINILIKIAKKYKLIISLPHIIYEKDIEFYKKMISQLVAEGLTHFEANSFTGISLISTVECSKYAGIGIPVYNHLAADFLFKHGFQSVYCAYEAESAVIEALSKTVRGSVEVLVYSKLALFISRVDGAEFKDGAVFKDKIGTEVECRSYGGTKHFISKKQFSLIDDKVKKLNICADSLTADIRHTKNTNEIMKKLFTGNFDENDSSSFNFFGKLV